MNKTIFDGKIISKKRIPVSSPEKIVDNNGKFIFGTFNEPLKYINMLDAKKPCKIPMPRMLKNSRLKNWEAVEVAFDEGFMTCATYEAGAIGFNIMMFFDKTEGTVYSWKQTKKIAKVTSHMTLIDSIKALKTFKSDFKIKNNFEKGKVKFDATIKNKKYGKAECHVEFTSCSDPSVVVIPFGENQALYTQKELFKVKGTLKFGDKTYIANERTTGIIDDHRGYYPYKMHYYWLTGMGTKKINGKDTQIGFNLTQNQSINPFDYNENLLWLGNESYTLPPVKFKILDNKKWNIKDDFGMVDVTFTPVDYHVERMWALLIDVDYKAPFGTKVEGYIKTSIDGEKIDVSGLHYMGENKKLYM